MRLVLQIAAGILAAPVLLALLVLGVAAAVAAVYYLSLAGMLVLAGMIAAGFAVQRFVLEPKRQ